MLRALVPSLALAGCLALPSLAHASPGAGTPRRSEGLRRVVHHLAAGSLATRPDDAGIRLDARYALRLSRHWTATLAGFTRIGVPSAAPSLLGRGFGLSLGLRLRF